MKKTLALLMTLILAALPLCAFAAVGDTYTFTSFMSSNVENDAASSWNKENYVIAVAMILNIVGHLVVDDTIPFDIQQLDINEAHVGYDGNSALIYAFYYGDETHVMFVDTVPEHESSYTVVADTRIGLDEALEPYGCTERKILDEETLGNALVYVADALTK